MNATHYYVAPSQARTMRRLPRQKVKRAINRTMPTEAGTYHWSEWSCFVRVYHKPRSKKLFVTPPGGIEIEVTPNIAGTFKRCKELDA